MGTGISGIFLSCIKGVQYPFEFQEATWDSFRDTALKRASSQVDAGTSGFLSSSDMDLWGPMEFEQGSQASSRVEIWNSASLSRCKRLVRLPVEFELA